MELIDSNTEKPDKVRRPAVISLLCLVSLILNVFQLVDGALIYDDLRGIDIWVISLFLISFIFIGCCIGFWLMKKKTFFIYILNVIFFSWVMYKISNSFIDLNTIIYLVIGGIIWVNFPTLR